MNGPLVSIIMPAHNAGRFIRQAITSVIEQTYSNWELWVIDDASIDNTSDIVRSFNDPRIRYCWVDRIGSPSGVRNVGLRKAEGELVAFLDADDWYFPNSIEMLIEPLLTHPQYSAVFGYANHVDEDGIVIPERNFLVPNDLGQLSLPHGYGLTWEDIVRGRMSCQLPALMVRKKIIDRIGFFNEDLCGPEDYEFYVRLFLDNKEKVCCLPRYIYHYRLHDTSLTKKPEKYHNIVKDCLKILDWMFVHPQLPTEAHTLKSLAYVEAYAYLARERLIANQADICRSIMLKAWDDENITRGDWCRFALPLIIRSYLPFYFNQFLIEFRAKLRRKKIVIPFAA